MDQMKNAQATQRIRWIVRKVVWEAYAKFIIKIALMLGLMVTLFWHYQVIPIWLSIIASLVMIVTSSPFLLGELDAIRQFKKNIVMITDAILKMEREVERKTDNDGGDNN